MVTLESNGIAAGGKSYELMTAILDYLIVLQSQERRDNPYRGCLPLRVLPPSEWVGGFDEPKGGGGKFPNVL